MILVCISAFVAMFMPSLLLHLISIQRCSVLRHPVSALKALILAHRLLAQVRLGVDALRQGTQIHV